MLQIPLNHYVALGLILFAIGVAGFVFRRNLLITFLCIELMLNSVNLIFITYGHFLKNTIGQMYVFFIMAVAAAEVSIGLAIIIMVYRTRGTIDMDRLTALKG